MFILFDYYYMLVDLVMEEEVFKIELYIIYIFALRYIENNINMLVKYTIDKNWL